MGTMNGKIISSMLLMALGAAFLPWGMAEGIAHIRKPGLNVQAGEPSYQPLFLDAEGSIYALGLSGSAWIWQRLSPDESESAQIASVAVRCQKRNTYGGAWTLYHYYLCPRLGMVQQLEEVQVMPEGRRKTIMKRQYSHDNWTVPEPDSVQAKLLQYAPAYLPAEYAGREMTVASLGEVRELASKAREALWEKATALGREPKLYLHWTAMHYGRFFCSYHINIDRDGTIYLSTRDFSQYTPGTWKRNDAAVNLTITGCTGSNPRTLGPEPPTDAQIETMAQVIAALAEGIGIPVDKQHVLTHGEAANNEDGLQLHQPYSWWNDSYGDKDTRGDLEYLGTKESPAYAPTDPQKQSQRGGSVLRSLARAYQKSGK